MPKAVSCRIEGLKELEHALLEETPKQARVAMREALNAGGDVMQRAIAQKARTAFVRGKSTGFTATHILKKTKLSVKEDEGEVSVGPAKEAYWAGWDEFGSIHNRPPEPFIRPAWEENKYSMLDIFIAKLGEKLGL